MATTTTAGAVLVGNPKFDLSEAEQRAALKSEQLIQAGAIQVAETTGAQVSLRSRDLTGNTLKELPGTEKEIEEVSTLLEHHGWTVQTYTGQNALEERVKAVRQPRVLHLATHGFFEKDEPKKLGEPGGEKEAVFVEDPMLRSGLYLVGANRVLSGSAPARDLDDGVFTAYEASQLNLQGTELVVLSACGTGLGKTEQGEGVFGLRRALQVAGAEAVLMSLWSVPDEETRELMALFYGKWLSGKEKHEALREAQLEMRKKVKARYREDRPSLWGAFVLVGR
jgi:CHAT domain-containing protein